MEGKTRQFSIEYGGLYVKDMIQLPDITTGLGNGLFRARGIGAAALHEAVVNLRIQIKLLARQSNAGGGFGILPEDGPVHMMHGDVAIIAHCLHQFGVGCTARAAVKIGKQHNRQAALRITGNRSFLRQHCPGNGGVSRDRSQRLAAPQQHAGGSAGPQKANEDESLAPPYLSCGNIGRSGRASISVTSASAHNTDANRNGAPGA